MIGRDSCSKADVSYVVAVRSTRHLREALLPHAGDKSILGLAVALQRLETLFPKWGPCLRDDGGKLKQKDLLKEAVVAAHGDFLLQLVERDRKRVELYSGAWADGWIRAIPSQAFDTTLSNIEFHDILSIRLGLSLFDADEECRVCPQTSDIYGHHCLSCNMIGKTTLHNLIRDEIYCALWGGGLGDKREPTQLLPKDPTRRPADILTDNQRGNISIGSLLTLRWYRLSALERDLGVQRINTPNTNARIGSRWNIVMSRALVSNQGVNESGSQSFSIHARVQETSAPKSTN